MILRIACVWFFLSIYFLENLHEIDVLNFIILWIDALILEILYVFNFIYLFIYSTYFFLYRKLHEISDFILFYLFAWINILVFFIYIYMHVNILIFKLSDFCFLYYYYYRMNFNSNSWFCMRFFYCDFRWKICMWRLFHVMAA